MRDFDAEEFYENYQKIFKNIKNDINELNLIKNSLLIFHRKRFQKEIKEISDIILLKI